MSHMITESTIKKGPGILAFLTRPTAYSSVRGPDGATLSHLFLLPAPHSGYQKWPSMSGILFLLYLKQKISSPRTHQMCQRTHRVRHQLEGHDASREKKKSQRLQHISFKCYVHRRCTESVHMIGEVHRTCVHYGESAQNVCAQNRGSTHSVCAR